MSFFDPFQIQLGPSEDTDGKAAAKRKRGDILGRGSLEKRLHDY
jgi:hypothetical protein